MGISGKAKAPFVALTAVLLPLLLLHGSACVLSAAVECRITYKYIEANDCMAWLPGGAVPKACQDAFAKRFNTPSDQLPIRQHGVPIRSREVAVLMTEVSKHMFCKTCQGRGVTAKVHQLNRQVDKVVWFRRGETTREKGIERVLEVGPVNVNIGCAKCVDRKAKQRTSRDRSEIAQDSQDVPYSYTYKGLRGTGVTPDIGKLRTLLGKLGRAVLRLDPKDPRSPVTRHAARCMLEKAAFDLDSYAVDLVRLSGLAVPESDRTLPTTREASEQSDTDPNGLQDASSRSDANAPAPAEGPPVGTPVVFIGRVADQRETRYGYLLLVRLYRTHTYVAVTCNGWVPVRKGQTVFVSGIIHDPGRPVPLIDAAVAVGVHRADPLFESKRPYQSSAEVSQTDPDRRLELARAYLSNNMKAKAIAVCREILKKYPKTDAAEEAQRLLIEMGE